MTQAPDVDLSERTDGEGRSGAARLRAVLAAFGLVTLVAGCSGDLLGGGDGSSNGGDGSENGDNSGDDGGSGNNNNNDGDDDDDDDGSGGGSS